MDSKAWALGNLAMELTKKDSKKALAIAEEIVKGLRYGEWDEYPVDPLIKIAGELLKPYPEKANNLIDQAIRVAKEKIEINEYEMRAGVLAEIAVELARIDPEKALAVVKEIEEIERELDEEEDGIYSVVPDKARALGEISVELAKKNPKKALAVANKIEDYAIKANALARISLELAKISPKKASDRFNQAIKTAEKIGNYEKRAYVLSEISVELARIDPEKALSLAKKVEDYAIKANALAKIAVELAKTNPKKAKEVITQAADAANNIISDEEKAQALAEIAVKMAIIDTMNLLEKVPEKVFFMIVEDGWDAKRIREFLKNYENSGS